jgi:CRP/FNR family cyclic AMP-dependent transcriptional regulator
MADTLVIVRRHQFAKFALLAQAFADEPRVRLIWDRRLREQRRECGSANPEDRRRRDRRSDRSKTWGHDDHLLLGGAERVDADARVNEEFGLDIEVRVGTVERCFESAGLRTVVHCRSGEVIFSQGDDADSMMYLLKGTVKLSVSGRREAIVGIVRSGDFFGEECLAGHSIRKRKATAMTRCTVLVVGRAAMLRLLRTERVLADRFMAHLLSRNVRVEDDLIDQFMSSCEQRLARTLLMLAGYGDRGRRKKIVPRITQGTLADIVGSTRSRINGFMRKFRRLGLVETDGSLRVHRSLLGIVSPCVRGSLRNRARNSPRSSDVTSGSDRAAGDGAPLKTVSR